MKLNFFLSLILFISLLLRIFHIGSIPGSLYGDEQAFAYNAYSILTTGTDEYGTKFPLEFRSFDDYKAPLPVYLLVPFIKIFGLNAVAIRLPVVIFSVLTVLAFYFLLKSFFSSKISLLATFLLAISPWHMHLSRGYFEATISLFFFTGGILFFLRSREGIKLKLVSMLFFALAVYSYFTPRILLPFFLIFLFIFNYRLNDFKIGFWKSVKIYILNLTILIILCLPLLYSAAFNKGLSRFNKLSEKVGSEVVQAVYLERQGTSLPKFWSSFFHNKITVTLRTFRDSYMEHFSVNFWYIFGDNSLRYFTGNRGMFYLLELPFLIIGLYGLWKDHRKAAVFFAVWILLAPIPASLVGKSYAVRSLAMLPAPFVFVAYGLVKSVALLKNNRLAVMSISLLFVFSIGGLLIRYFLEYPVYAATWWGWENKAAIDYAKKEENNYDNIFLSDYYSGMPLAFAVYHQVNPNEYRQAIRNPILMADGRKMFKFGKYYIGSLDIDEKRYNLGIIPAKSLYIGRPEEMESKKNIYAPGDGRVIYKIYNSE